MKLRMISLKKYNIIIMKQDKERGLVIVDKKNFEGNV